MQTDYPLEMVRPSSGRIETAYSRSDEVDLRIRGFQRLHETPQEYGLFPLFLTGKGLPDLVVETEDQAKEAAARGYALPSEAAIAAAAEGYAAAHEPPAEDTYIPAEYPKSLRHPEHRAAIPVTWTYDLDGTGTAIPGVPEHLPDQTVYSPAEERAWLEKGWTSPSPHIDEPAPSPADASADDPEYLEFLRWKQAGGRPASTPAARKRKLSGAARRKLHRLRPEQQEIAP